MVADLGKDSSAELSESPKPQARLRLPSFGPPLTRFLGTWTEQLALLEPGFQWLWNLRQNESEKRRWGLARFLVRHHLCPFVVSGLGLLWEATVLFLGRRDSLSSTAPGAALNPRDVARRPSGPC